MMNLLKAIRTLALIAAMVAVPALALAQADARFTGSVIDPSGSMVPGSIITLQVSNGIPPPPPPPPAGIPGLPPEIGSTVVEIPGLPPITVPVLGPPPPAGPPPP